jgi:hypothetical protein
MATERVAKLDEAAQKKFDAFKSKSEFARKGARAGEEAKKLKTEICEAMGDCIVAELPDGRRLQKVSKSAHRKAAKAYDYSWEELNEVQAA